MEIRPCKPTMVGYHHSGSEHDTTESIRTYHKGPQRKYGDIGYNFVIEKDGTVGIGRDMKYSGAHNPGRAPDGSGYTMNQRSVGVCFVGNFDVPTKVMPKVQFDAGVRKLIEIYKQLGVAPSWETFIGHHETFSTACPGRYFPSKLVLDAVIEGMKGGKYKVKHAVICFTMRDFSAGAMVSAQLGNCPIYFRDGRNDFVHPDWEHIDHIVVAGGAFNIKHKDATNCCGDHAPHTAIKCAEYVLKLKQGK